MAPPATASYIYGYKAGCRVPWDSYGTLIGHHGLTWARKIMIFHMSNEQKTGYLGYIGDDKLPIYVGIIYM